MSTIPKPSGEAATEAERSPGGQVVPAVGAPIQPGVPASLWRNRPFQLLWGGQTVSIVGTSITELALPWIVLRLTGSAFQMGIVSAVFMAVYIAFSLPAGAWGDRWDRRKMMLFADVGRGLLLLSLPIAFALHHLTMPQIYAVNGGLGFLTVLFDVGFVSCLPSIVRKEQLAEANGRQEFSRSGAEIVGPQLGGILVAFLKAANAILVDSLSYFFSAITLFFIQGSFAPQRSDSGEQESIWRQIAEGLHYVRRQETVFTIAILTGVSNFISNSASVLVIYRAQKELHFTATHTGTMLTIGSVGAVLAALVASELGKRYRLSRIMLISASFSWIPVFLLAFTANLWVMGALFAVGGITNVVWNVQSMAPRQSIIPSHLLGRAASVLRMIAC